MASLFLSGIQFSAAVAGDLYSSYAPVPRLRVHRRLSSSVVASSATLYDVDPSATRLSLYPLHRTKIIHVVHYDILHLYFPLVRHAQGFHNVAGDKDPRAYLSYDLLDASLTPFGWDQVDNLREYVRETGLLKKIDLVVTSPLTRTMQTAVGVFGGDAYIDGVDARPLMVTDAGNSGRPSISSLDCPPFLAFELCREHLGVNPCDKRRSIGEYKIVQIETNEDTWWKEDYRERYDEIAARGLKLRTRKENEIAVVSHAGFLFRTLNQFGDDCHPVIKNEISTM
ncbi:Phosphoglycerate mutase-like protein [Drosera capensis]